MEGIGEAPVEMATRNKQGFASAFARKPLILDGARSRNRTGTPLRAGDFKSHASTSFAIRAVARYGAHISRSAILTVLSRV